MSGTHVGPYGWIGVWLDGDLDADALTELIEDAYTLAIPKKRTRK